MDLTKERLTNRQYTRFWFCEECEENLGINETYASELCARIEKDPLIPQSYDERFLRFATSISWRSLKIVCEDKDTRTIRREWEAYKHWKRYLLGKRPGINPYTQHIFVVFDNAHGLDKAIGGELCDEQPLVLSQIGPLIIVGLLAPDKLSSAEQRTWRNSRIRQTGGEFAPIQCWRTGENAVTNNITPAFTKILFRHEATTVHKVLTGDWRGREKRPRKPG